MKKTHCDKCDIVLDKQPALYQSWKPIEDETGWALTRTKANDKDFCFDCLQDIIQRQDKRPRAV